MSTEQLQSLASTGTLPGLDDLGAELLSVEERRSRGHTGERFARDAERLQVVLELLALGIGKERIAQLVGTSVGVIVQVAHRHAADVVREKKELAAFCRAGATRLVRRIVEEADRVPIASAALNAGILIDKAAALDAEIPAAAPGTSGAITHEQINAYIAGLAAARPVCGGADVGQKGLPAASQAVIEATPTDSESATSERK